MTHLYPSVTDRKVGDLPLVCHGDHTAVMVISGLRHLCSRADLETPTTLANESVLEGTNEQSQHGADFFFFLIFHKEL